MASKPSLKAKPRRPLTLHVSALSDAEYTAYTDWLSEIVGPLDGVRSTLDNQADGGGFGNDISLANYDEKMTRRRADDGGWDPEGTLVGVREARGWIRGRWGNGLHALDGIVIDSILKNFSPDLAPQDVITGGQFFAVMRLVCHAQGNKKFQGEQGGKSLIDESLVFVQADPNYNPIESPKLAHTAHKKDSSISSVLSDLSASASTSTTRKPPLPPFSSSRRSSEISPNQVQSSVTTDLNTSHNAPALPPRIQSSNTPISPNFNPFTRGLTPSRSTPDKVPVTTIVKDASPLVPEPSRNPFRPTKAPPPPPPQFTQSSTNASESDNSFPSSPLQRQTGPIPPLPPRKTVILPPPRHASIRPTLPHSHSTATVIPTTTYVPPPLPPHAPPPKPPKVTSPLIKQSLEAAKGAQSLKASLDNLSRERQLEVIKKSGSGASRVTGVFKKDAGDYGERLTARSISPPHSIYDVATARLGGYQSRSKAASTATSASVSASSLSSSVSSSGISNGKDAAPSLAPGLRPKLLTDTTFSSPTSRTLANLSLASPTNSPGGGNPRRTKSLHHPSPSTATPGSGSAFPFDQPNNTNQPPPPPRRRPESIQVFRSVNEANISAKMNSPNPFTSPSQQLAQDWPPPKLASSNFNANQSPRRISPSTVATHLSEPTTSHTNSPSTSTGIAVLDSLQRTFSTLSTLKPGSGFESARIRAEGRVLPSGFSKVGGKRKGVEKERLMDDVDDNDSGDDRGRLSEDRQGGRRSDTVTRDDTGLSSISGLSQDSAMDNLKIPMHPDEGWVSLS